MRKRKSTRRATTGKKTAQKRTGTPRPHQITIVDEIGTARPQKTILKDGEQVQFDNEGGLEAHISFSGDRALFEQDGSNAGSQDVNNGELGGVSTGKRNGKDRLVFFEVTTSKSTPSRKGNGTIKVGQTLTEKTKEI
jgi:hypothetical protein